MLTARGLKQAQNTRNVGEKQKREKLKQNTHKKPADFNHTTNCRINTQWS